ncbi:MAG: phage replisome organizer N-terminal domain-containing protein [Lachnospiraceae bacterium]|nr:phage replisome organizer N-terminal domain-containing protein [Lachnospiraceae bacterium]
MSDIKWIKFYVNMFDNRKIRFIDTLPERDAILVIWFKLMALAGLINDGGEVYLTREIPYTDELLSAQFNRPLNTVRLALKTFEQLEMIEIVDDILQLTNWQEYQGSEQLDRIKELGKIRQKNFRDRKRITAKNDSNVTRNVTESLRVTQGVTHDVTQSNAVDKIREEEDKNTLLRECNAPAPARESVTEGDMMLMLGEYGNVFLKTDEYLQLQEDFPDDYNDRIDNLSRYMKSKGVNYDDHYATIRKWAIEDAKKKTSKGSGGGSSNAFNKYDGQREYTSDEYADLELAMRKRRAGDPGEGDNHD